jgi:hypothetical protein
MTLIALVDAGSVEDFQELNFLLRGAPKVNASPPGLQSLHIVDIRSAAVKSSEPQTYNRLSRTNSASMRRVGERQRKMLSGSIAAFALSGVEDIR